MQFAVCRLQAAFLPDGENFNLRSKLLLWLSKRWFILLFATTWISHKHTMLAIFTASLNPCLCLNLVPLSCIHSSSAFVNTARFGFSDKHFVFFILFRSDWRNHVLLNANFQEVHRLGRYAALVRSHMSGWENNRTNSKNNAPSPQNNSSCYTRGPVELQAYESCITIPQTSSNILFTSVFSEHLLVNR